MDKEKIQVALAFCDPKGTYARHAAVTAASIYKNTKSSVCVHIIHDDTLSGENKAKLSETARRFQQEINFINVENMLDESKVDVSKLTIDGARGTLFRLLIPDLLDIDKIIYLDCDIVVNMDINELWSVPLDDNAVSAVHDVWSLDYINNGERIPWRLGKAWECMSIPSDGYFNAGVLVMNLKKIRESYTFLDDVAAFYSKFRKCITLADQDCLNYIFCGDCLYLDQKFNHIKTENISKSQLDGNIWHMAGGAAKPWTLYTRPNVDELYWQYLMETPYCKDAEELITLMLSGLSSPAYTHLHSSDCTKRLIKQMKDNILRAHIWTVPYILIRIIMNKIMQKKTVQKSENR